MSVNLDPTRWMVAFAGFVVDWIMTREWKRIAITSIPLLFLVTVAGLVYWGSRLDKHKLAARYLELGEKEIADWESSWAADAPTEKASNKPTDNSAKPAENIAKEGDPSPADSQAAAENKDTAGEDSGSKPKELSRFAEVLFRRVQLLEPNERSQFVIGVTMAQRGATGQARKMLSKIAPDDRPGYAPAHAWIASNLLRQPITQENIKVVKHHIKQGAKWDRVPEQVLLVGSNLFLQTGERDTAIDLMKRAADRNALHHLGLVQVAKLVENKVLLENSALEGEKYFRSELEKDANDLPKRLALVQLLAITGRLDEAEQVIQAGIEIQPAGELTRGLSEVYRLRFLKSLQQDGSNLSGDLQMLDLAMRTDPTNPMIAEEIAKLARFNGKSPGNELIEKLQQFLAEGKATAATHAWIAELYLERGNYAKAKPHLEQVVTRLPNASQCLNNLAYVIAEIDPKSIDSALAMAQRAVQIEPNKADYFDTLAKVLVVMNRQTEAITALESAIELSPERKDFHENVAKLYDATQNADMAARHRSVITRIEEWEAKNKAAQSAAQSTTSSEPAPSPSAEAGAEEQMKGRVARRPQTQR